MLIMGVLTIVVIRIIVIRIIVISIIFISIIVISIIAIIVLTLRILLIFKIIRKFIVARLLRIRKIYQYHRIKFPSKPLHFPSDLWAWNLRGNLGDDFLEG